jgi:hypothetical protein
MVLAQPDLVETQVIGKAAQFDIVLQRGVGALLRIVSWR